MSVMNRRPEKSLIEEVALATGIAESFIEKDWFVTQVIGVISNIHHNNFEVIFTGGTALSKAHKLLQRFSEDVDFRVRVSGGNPNRRALSAFKNEVVEALRQYGFSISDEQIHARDSNRFFSIDLDYETYFAPANALRPHIQIEITLKNTLLPPHYLPVSSFVNELSNQLPEVARIGCIDPVESAVDKLSAIAWRVPDRLRGNQDDDPALVRHIHDLAILKDRALAHINFAGMVITAMEMDDQRTRNAPSFSGLPIPQKFELMLNKLVNEKEYLQEYEQFVKGVSYAVEGHTPDFTSAVVAVRALVDTVIGGSSS